MLAFIAAQQKYFAQLDCVELELEADSEDDGEVEETSISPDDVVRASLRDTAKLEPEADDAKLLADDEDGSDDAGATGRVSSTFSRRGSAVGASSAESLFDGLTKDSAASTFRSALKSRSKGPTHSSQLTLTDVADDRCEVQTTVSASTTSNKRTTADDPHHHDASSGVQPLHAPIHGAARKRRRSTSPKGPSNRDALIASIRACDAVKIAQVLKTGVSIDWFDADGCTPLGLALKTATIDTAVPVAEVLLRRGADPNKACICSSAEHVSERAGPLELAMESGIVELVLLLLRFGGLPQRVPAASDFTLRQYSVEGGFEATASNILRKALKAAVDDCDASAVLALCAHGAKVGDLDEQGRSHLHRALASQRSGRADPSRLAVIEALLQSGADPSAADGLGVLPLSYPVLRGDKNLLSLLLRHGAQVANATVEDEQGEEQLSMLEWSRRVAVDPSICLELEAAAAQQSTDMAAAGG